MAMRPKARVHVALIPASLCALCCVCLAAGGAGGSTSVSGLLTPYDELYYRGVWAYFAEDWEKAAEYFELSISTREALRKIRRKCHDECSTAGDETVPRLGSLQHRGQFFTTNKAIQNQAEEKWLNNCMRSFAYSWLRHNYLRVRSVTQDVSCDSG